MLRIVILLGIVSMFGDIVYEGARSVIGPFFRTLGITPLVLGVVIGISELLSYISKLLSGYLVDRTGRYWTFTILGYVLVFAIPLIAFPKDWRIIAFLIVLERMGKGLRGPARDTILSFVTGGLGFGIHEFLDQIGAVLGPILFFAILSLGYGYKLGFELLLIPATLLLLALLLAYSHLPNPKPLRRREVGGSFGLYVLFVFFTFLGFVNFQLIAYHLKGVVPDAEIPLLYALAMGLDGLLAPMVGWIYDRIGLRILNISPILFALLPLSFLYPLAVVIYGVCLSFQETVMRVAVADLVKAERRGISYGLLNVSQGLGLFIGSVVVGALYGSIIAIFAFVFITQMLASITLSFMGRGTSGSWPRIRLS